MFYFSRREEPPLTFIFGTAPNVTAHPSTASVPITVLLYNGPLLCGFNVPIKGLTVYAGCFVEYHWEQFAAMLR